MREETFIFSYFTIFYLKKKKKNQGTPWQLYPIYEPRALSVFPAAAVLTSPVNLLDMQILGSHMLNQKQRGGPEIHVQQVLQKILMFTNVGEQLLYTLAAQCVVV